MRRAGTGAAASTGAGSASPSLLGPTTDDAPVAAPARPARQQPRNQGLCCPARQAPDPGAAPRPPRARLPAPAPSASGPHPTQVGRRVRTSSRESSERGTTTHAVRDPAAGRRVRRTRCCCCGCSAGVSGGGRRCRRWPLDAAANHRARPLAARLGRLQRQERRASATLRGGGGSSSEDETHAEQQDVGHRRPDRRGRERERERRKPEGELGWPSGQQCERPVEERDGHGGLAGGRATSSLLDGVGERGLASRRRTWAGAEMRSSTSTRRRHMPTLAWLSLAASQPAW